MNSRIEQFKAKALKMRDDASVYEYEEFVQNNWRIANQDGDEDFMRVCCEEFEEVIQRQPRTRWSGC